MRLRDYLPKVTYGEDGYSAAIQDAIESELILLQRIRDDLMMQLRPSSSTWGMDEYEREYGLAVQRNKPYEQRLARYRAKRRARATTTVMHMETVLQSFYAHKVKVEEHYEQYIFAVRFPAIQHNPPSLDDIHDTLEEIKPAHLGYNFIFEQSFTQTIHAAHAAHTLTRHTPVLTPPRTYTALLPQHTASGVHSYFKAGVANYS